jgi:hypothetical protein
MIAAKEPAYKRHSLDLYTLCQLFYSLFLELVDLTMEMSLTDRIELNSWQKLRQCDAT